MSDYQMPTADLGDKVLYYRHAGAQPSLALVTDVFMRLRREHAGALYKVTSGRRAV